MKYPIRNKHGELWLRTGDFGIRDPVYLYALKDFLLGYSIEQTAERLSLKFKLKISRTMIRDNFRIVLYNELRRFNGDSLHSSFLNYCKEHDMPDDFNGKNSIQMSFCTARYLIEIFDLKEPIHIDYFNTNVLSITSSRRKIK